MPPEQLPADPPPAGEAPPSPPAADGPVADAGRAVDRRVLWAGAALVALVALWAAFRNPLADAAPGLDPEAREQEERRARAEYAAMLRQSPEPLGLAPAAGALESGDAEDAGGRYVDYYAFDADSAAFAVLVTSDAFAPDLAVRSPGGESVAASALLRTDGRAEITGLRGPGRFEVAVTSRWAGASGPYHVEVVPAGAVDSVHVDGEARMAGLGGGAPRAGRYERAFAVVAGPEAPVILRVASTAFAPRVHLLGPNGEVEGTWGTTERVVGDSLRAVLVRYTPGWEAPYRLIVTSEEPGARGPFALDARSVQVRDLRADSTRTEGVLGSESWLLGGRYVDTYRLRARGETRATIRATSDRVPPGLRLWRIGARDREAVAEDLNAAGAGAVSIARTLDAGEYYVEVVSGGEVEPGGPVRGGPYTLDVKTEPTAPPPPPTPSAGPAPGTRVFATEVRRTGQSGGSTFEVGVTHVAISYPAESRTRVQLSVSVRSVDYAGNWAPWESFAGKAYLVDDTGRRYQVSVAESRSPSGPRADPGTVRRGTVVFYAPEIARGLRRVVLVASIGEETVTLPIPVP